MWLRNATNYKMHFRVKHNHRVNFIYFLLFIILSAASIAPSIYSTFYAMGQCKENTIGHFRGFNINNATIFKTNMLKPPPG